MAETTQKEAAAEGPPASALRGRTAIRFLRAVALLEGASYLLLLGVAMPLKYLAGMPGPVRAVGAAHGGLFLLYVAAVAWAGAARRWPAGGPRTSPPRCCSSGRSSWTGGSAASRSGSRPPGDRSARPLTPSRIGCNREGRQPKGGEHEERRVSGRSRGVSWAAKAKRVAVGDTVCYVKAFLQSTGQYTGEAPQARGVVTALVPLGGTTFAEIDWRGADLPARVNVANLSRVTDKGVQELP